MYLKMARKNSRSRICLKNEYGIHNKLSKKERRAMVEYYTDIPRKNYELIFLSSLIMCFTGLIFGYAIILAVV